MDYIGSPGAINVAVKKRSRNENWLEQDKILLKELVRERVHAIENKNTDTNTNKKKKDAWLDLHNTFNSLCIGAQRSIAQLKNQWTFLKITVKKERAQHRRKIVQTGGGPSPQEPDDEGADNIMSWLPFEFSVDSNEFDNDSRPRVEFVTPPAALISVENIEVVPTQLEVVSTMPEVVPTPREVIPNPLELHPTPLELLPTPLKVVPVPLKVDDSLDTCGNTSANTSLIKKKYNKIKKQKLQKQSETTAAASKIMEVENKCRQELHELQMDNERKRARNLDLKYELMSAKLNYYKTNYPTNT